MRYHDGTATGKLPAVMTRDHADRVAEREQLLVRHLARHGLAVQPPALAEEEVAGVDDLADLAERLGVRLADLPGDQPGQRLGVRLDHPADVRDRAAAHRRGHVGPGRLSRRAARVAATKVPASPSATSATTSLVRAGLVEANRAPSGLVPGSPQ